MKKSNPWADLALAIQFLTALLAWLSLTGSLRADGELARLDARDAGVVMKHGDGPNQCDYLGARDVWVWANNATYYMPYDGAGPEGWLEQKMPRIAVGAQGGQPARHCLRRARREQHRPLGA